MDGRVLQFTCYRLLFTISAYEVRTMAEVTGLFAGRHPTWAIILPFMWIGLYLIIGGINTLARLFEIIFPITIVIFLLVAFLSLGIFEIDNLRPVLGLGISPMLKGIKTTVLAFLGSEIIFAPCCVYAKAGQSRKSCSNRCFHPFALLRHHRCHGHRSPVD